MAALCWMVVPGMRLACWPRPERRLAVYQYLRESSRAAPIRSCAGSSSSPHDEGVGRGPTRGVATSSPRPSPPSDGGEGVSYCGSAALSCIAGFNLPTAAREQRSADYKSAIRQIKNLRYGKHIPNSSSARYARVARSCRSGDRRSGCAGFEPWWSYPDAPWRGWWQEIFRPKRFTL